MSDFINTVDLLGDDTVIDSIFNRTITEFLDDRITVIGSYAFYGCTSLTKIDAPNVTDISNNNIFNGCSNLEEINLPNVSGKCGVRVFESCYSVKRLDLRNIISIDASIFTSCINLEEIILTNLEDIGNQAFYGCSKLSKLDLPKVNNIKGNAFLGCKSLSALILRTNSICNLANTNAFISSNSSPIPIVEGTGYIYVPKALVESYKIATNWTVLADQIRAIEDYPEITGGL